MDKIYTKDKRWELDVDLRDGINFVVCADCGTILENFEIKALETGNFYCSKSCAKEHVKENEPEGGY